MWSQPMEIQLSGIFSFGCPLGAFHHVGSQYSITQQSSITEPLVISHPDNPAAAFSQFFWITYTLLHPKKGIIFFVGKCNIH